MKNPSVRQVVRKTDKRPSKRPGAEFYPCARAAGKNGAGRKLREKGRLAVQMPAPL